MVALLATPPVRSVVDYLFLRLFGFSFYFWRVLGLILEMSYDQGELCCFSMALVDVYVDSVSHLCSQGDCGWVRL